MQIIQLTGNNSNFRGKKVNVIDLCGVFLQIVHSNPKKLDIIDTYKKITSGSLGNQLVDFKKTNNTKVLKGVGVSMEKTVLIVEDDSNIAELLRLYLEKEEYRVLMAADGNKGVELFRQNELDLILLDLMLPGMDGWGVCRAVRQSSQVPIIMLTAKGETMDKVTGLKMGADDYITKPFEMKEVLARIEAVLRRGALPEESAVRKLYFDKLVIDLESFELVVEGKKVDAPPKEMELLFHLASSPNRVYTRNQLLDEVWGFDYFGDSRTVDVHIKRLREKLEGVSEKWSLKTVWGVGYKFEVL